MPPHFKGCNKSLAAALRFTQSKSFDSSVDTVQIVHSDYKKDCRSFRQRNHENVLIGILVSEAGNSKQRDDRTIMRQCVHAAACHGRDAMQYLEWNFCCLCSSDEIIG